MEKRQRSGGNFQQHHRHGLFRFSVSSSNFRSLERARRFRPIKENYRDDLPSCINIPLTAMHTDKQSPPGEQFSRWWKGLKAWPNANSRWDSFSGRG